jgi:outer membrane protein assembly factor BamB
MSGHTIKMLMAIRLGRTGTLTGTDSVVWSTARGASYTPSPLLHDGHLYVVTDSGMVSSFEAATGKPVYQQARLPQPYNFKASPVGAAGKMYLATEEGDIVVVRLGDRLDVLATNTFDNHSFIASPVIVDGTIYLRSRTHLFAVR